MIIIMCITLFVVYTQSAVLQQQIQLISFRSEHKRENGEVYCMARTCVYVCDCLFVWFYSFAFYSILNSNEANKLVFLERDLANEFYFISRITITMQCWPPLPFVAVTSYGYFLLLFLVSVLFVSFRSMHVFKCWFIWLSRFYTECMCNVFGM